MGRAVRLADLEGLGRIPSRLRGLVLRLTSVVPDLIRGPLGLHGVVESLLESPPRLPKVLDVVVWARLSDRITDLDDPARRIQDDHDPGTHPRTDTVGLSHRLTHRVAVGYAHLDPARRERGVSTRGVDDLPVSPRHGGRRDGDRPRTRLPSGARNRVDEEGGLYAVCHQSSSTLMSMRIVLSGSVSGRL